MVFWSDFYDDNDNNEHANAHNSLCTTTVNHNRHWVRNYHNRKIHKTKRSCSVCLWLHLSTRQIAIFSFQRCEAKYFDFFAQLLRTKININSTLSRCNLQCVWMDFCVAEAMTNGMNSMPTNTLIILMDQNMINWLCVSKLNETYCQGSIEVVSGDFVDRLNRRSQ